MGDLPLPAPMGCWECQGLNAPFQVRDVGSLVSWEKVFRNCFAWSELVKETGLKQVAEVRGPCQGDVPSGHRDGPVGTANCQPSSQQTPMVSFYLRA